MPYLFEVLIADDRDPREVREEQHFVIAHRLSDVLDHFCDEDAGTAGRTLQAIACRATITRDLTRGTSRPATTTAEHQP